MKSTLSKSGAGNQAQAASVQQPRKKGIKLSAAQEEANAAQNKKGNCCKR